MFPYPILLYDFIHLPYTRRMVFTVTFIRNAH